MGSREQKIWISFYKIMFPNFTRQLRIPKFFVEKYGHILSAKRFKLRMPKTGETWNVKLERADDGDYYFKGGWNRFADDVGLKLLEYVVFEYSEKSTFDVFVYGIDGMEKGQNSDISESENDATAEDVNLEPVEVEAISESALYFEILLKPYQQRRLHHTKEFATTAGLIDKKSVKLEYVPTGYSWDVGVYIAPSTRFKMSLAKGWPAFCRAKLTFGNTYSFEYKPNKNVIEVNETCTK